MRNPDDLVIFYKDQPLTDAHRKNLESYLEEPVDNMDVFEDTVVAVLKSDDANLRAAMRTALWSTEQTPRSKNAGYYQLIWLLRNYRKKHGCLKQDMLEKMKDLWLTLSYMRHHHQNSVIFTLLTICIIGAVFSSLFHRT